MAIRSSLNVSLTPRLEKFVLNRVEEGRYQTASEVVREGLRLLEERERQRDLAFRALKSKLKRSASEAERGDLIDPEDVLQLIAQKKRQRARGR